MKAKILEKSGVCICALTGNEFRHDNSEAGRAAAIQKVTAHQSAALERMREKQPGLTDAQRFNPRLVPHKETRTEGELKAKRMPAVPHSLT